MALNNTTITTGIVRLSYAHLFEKSATEGNEPKYSASFIIPKKDKETIKKINAAVEEAIEKGVSEKWKGARPKKLKLPLRDGDEERSDSAYENAMFVNANSRVKPFVVDRNKKPIMDKEDAYSGCYGMAVLSFYPYDSNGNKGVGCGLVGFVKVKEGEALGSRLSMDDAFSEIDFDGLDDDDDFE